MHLDLLIIWNIIVDRNVFIALTIQLILNKEEYDFNWVKVEVFYKILVRLIIIKQTITFNIVNYRRIRRKQ